jgi:hypothetical protein
MYSDHQLALWLADLTGCAMVANMIRNCVTKRYQVPLCPSGTSTTLMFVMLLWLFFAVPVSFSFASLPWR